MRQSIRDMFQTEGIKNVSTHATAESLRNLMSEIPPDMLVLSDDFDSSVFDMVKEVRHNQLGDNPFVLITVLVDPKHRDALQKAVQSGVDDIVVKPLQSTMVHERLRLVAFHRKPFIATDDYVGPERKGATPAHFSVRRVEVLNTLREKAYGRTFDQFELKEAIEESVNKVLEAQLNTHSYKLGQVCDLVLEAYETNEITPEVEAELSVLSNVLREAALVAARLKDSNLQGLCLSLAETISELERHYTEPADSDLDLLRKLAQAFRMAVDSAAARNMEDDLVPDKYKDRVAGRAVDI